MEVVASSLEQEAYSYLGKTEWDFRRSFSSAYYTQQARKKTAALISIFHSSPESYEIELTMKCNLKCAFCFQNSYRSQHSAQKDLSFAQIRSLLEKIKPQRILVTGGEAMLRPDFFDVLDVLATLGTKVHLLSNGTFFSPAIIEKIKSYNNIREITFSLDYFSPEKHDTLRGKKGTFSSVLRAISNLRSTFPISVNTVLFKENVEDVKKIIHFFSTRNMHVYLHIHEFFSDKEIEQTRDRLSTLFSKPAQSIALLVDAQNLSDSEIEKRNGAIQDIQLFSQYYPYAFFLPLYLNDPSIRPYSENDVEGTCGYKDVRRINHQGKVVVCEKIQEALGTYLTQSVGEINASEVVQQLQHHFGKNKPLPICKTCAKFKACANQSRAPKRVVPNRIMVAPSSTAMR